MDVKVSWEKELQFLGSAASGSSVLMDSHAGPATGVGPVEMVALALAGCTAMDVISILGKTRQDVTRFDVEAHAERATDYPKVITSASLEYMIVGRSIDEFAVITAIDRSIKKYCPVYAMMKTVFPIELHYSIFEDNGQAEPTLIKTGLYTE